MQQVEMPFVPEEGEAMPEVEDKKRTRFTTKAKQESVVALKDLILKGWDAPDVIWRLIDFLNSEVKKANERKES